MSSISLYVPKRIFLPDFQATGNNLCTKLVFQDGRGLLETWVGHIGANTFQAATLGGDKEAEIQNQR